MNADNQPTTLRRRMTAEETKAYWEEKYPIANYPTCCLCGEKTECPFGNNPAPVASRGKCCGACNNAVVFVRMGLIPLALAKKNKKNLKLLYDSLFQQEPEPEPVVVYEDEKHRECPLDESA